MSKNKKPRSKGHRPRPVSQVGGLFAISKKIREIELKMPLPEDYRQNVAIAYHESIEAMTSGMATEHSFDTIVYALNIGLVLAELGLGAEYKDLIDVALTGMWRAKNRFHETGKFGLDGDALLALKDVADLHHEQIRLATMQELEHAVDEMHKRIREGKLVAEEVAA